MLWIAVTLPLLPLEAVKPPLALPRQPEYPDAPRNRHEAGALLAESGAASHAAIAGIVRDAETVGAAAAVSARPPSPNAPSAQSGTDAANVRCHALADHVRILIPDLDAHRLGVRAGNTRSHALALAPQIAMLTPDPAREKAALEALALALLAFTPNVAFAEGHTLLLEVGAGLRLFGGLRVLFSRVASTVETLGHTARFACAPTAWGAWLLAAARAERAGRRWRVVKQATLARTLDTLPVSLLPFAAEHGDVFEQIGCTTLADLRRLPRAGIVRRFGDDVLTLLAQAFGEHPDPREYFQAPASFHAQLELQARVDSAEALLFAARRLVVQLAGWLGAHHAALRKFELRLEHELASRHAPRTSVLRLGWAVPSRDADHLIWLLREKLNQTALAAPVIGLKLVADEVSEYAAPSGTLFPMPEASDESMARLMERLGARLGAQNVLQLSTHEDHRPERAMQAAAYREPAAGRRKPSRAKKPAAQEAGAAQQPPLQAVLDLPESPLPSQPRPVWMLERPLRLVVRDERPVYRRPLKTLTRTERIEAGWWDGEGVERDYYVAGDDQGRMFWVYRERLSGQWFLQGLFG